jgi:hypothetical protein
LNKHEILRTDFVKNAIGRKNTSDRFARAETAETSAGVCDRFDCTSIGLTEINVGTVSKIVNEDGRLPFRRGLAGWFSIWKRSMNSKGGQKILQLPAKFVPRFFTDEQKQSRVFMWQKLLDGVSNDQN